MSCWVVPSLASELWQIPLEQLWRRIREGQLVSKLEDGFTFVDVAPDGPKLTGPNLPPHLRPATFTAAFSKTEDEEATDVQPGPTPVTQPDLSIHPDDLLDDPTASKDLGDWRLARKRASRLRVPPRRIAV